MYKLIPVCLAALCLFTQCKTRKAAAESTPNTGSSSGSSSSSSSTSSGSSSSGTASKSKHILDGTWQFETMPGKQFDVKELFPGNLPDITFSIGAGQIGGFAGCNRYAAKISVDQELSQMKISQMALLTKMACPSSADNAFTGILEGVNRYEVKGGKLSLYNFKFEMLTLRKVSK